MALLAPDDHTSAVDLSVIILNWNARDYLVAALQSIIEQVWQHSIQLIVVDNASNLDDSVETVRRDFPQAMLIAHPQNVGFAGGNNIGLQQARGRYVLFLNPDTVVHLGAFDTLISWMDDHPQVGACGPKLLNSDGSLQASCRAFPSIGAGFFRNTPLGRLWPNNPWTRSYLMENFAHDREASVDWLSGSALLVRREAIDALVKQEGRVWDEKYFMYCEDVDLCYRLKELGWPRMYVPQTTITHRIGASSDWAQGAMIRRFHASMLRFFFKHYARGPKVLLAPLVLVGVALRALGAVIKLYRGYIRMGGFGDMIKRKFGRG
jgi:GT2 family glycosyltransferase